MHLETLTDKIFLIHDFLTREECLQYIVQSEQTGYELAKVNTESGQRILTHVRNNDRSFLNSPEVANTLFERAKPFLPATYGNTQLIGLNELFRFYRYTTGHRFKMHVDGSFVRNEQEASYYTFMIYLNDNYLGGETKFPFNTVAPKQGTALVFLHAQYHEGCEILKGVKYVLRTDIMYRSN